MCLKYKNMPKLLKFSNFEKAGHIKENTQASRGLWKV